MSVKFVVFIYFIIPTALSVLAYAVLLDLVGKPLAIVAGVCVAALFDIAFCNMIGLPIKWK